MVGRLVGLDNSGPVSAFLAMRREGRLKQNYLEKRHSRDSQSGVPISAAGSTWEPIKKGACWGPTPDLEMLEFRGEGPDPCMSARPPPGGCAVGLGLRCFRTGHGYLAVPSTCQGPAPARRLRQGNAVQPQGLLFTLQSLRWAM